jgi:putative NADH-flavin reductase
MKVLVLGAAGRTGRELVAQGLERGHHVTAFVRDPSRLDVEHDRLKVAVGDVTRHPTVIQAIEGQQGVLCALGAHTPIRRDRTLILGMQHIVTAMSEASAKRLIYLSFLGVLAGRRQLSLLGRILVAPILLRDVSADHAAKEAIIMSSALDWTIVRPPRLTEGPRTCAYRHGVDIRAKSAVPTISRADLADFMLNQLDDPTYIRETPAIMY